MPRTHRILAALAVCSFLSVPALAQVAPPPPPKPDPIKLPEFTPPTPEVTPEQAERIRQRREERERRQRARQRHQLELPDLPYDSLVEHDDEGYIVRHERPVHLMALERNPTIGEQVMEEAQPVIEQRMARMERLVIENVDLMLMIEDGVLERASFAEQGGLRELTELVRPFQEQGNITEELEREGVLTEMQSVFNSRIAREYESAVTREIREGGGRDTDSSPLDLVTRFVLTQVSQEARWVFGKLLEDAAANITHIAGRIDLNSDEAAALRQAEQRLNANENPRHVMVDLLNELSDSAQQQLLELTVEMRDDA